MCKLLCAGLTLAVLVSASWAQDKPVPTSEAAAHMTVPAGFHVSLFAGEPDVVQPIATCFDDRGRLWVIENFSYPNWITDGKPGHDRVLIFDDPDGTGHFTSRKVFFDNGSNLSGIEVGFGGVWLCSTPNLLYIPLDKTGDKPAGPPRVVLDGWSLNAKHNVFNRLTWGPDGWLYGCNGILDTSHVGKPGSAPKDRTPINCGVWRYHPTKERFEVFAWGTTNPWGLDFDDRGQIFITNCVIKHLWHVIQGAHYQRMFGEDLNPNVYALMESCADHIHWAGGDWTTSRGAFGAHSAAGGGHAHAGAMVYLGDNWPDEYRDSIFMCNIHGSRVNNDLLERSGSGYIGHHGADFLFANDPWFRGLDLHYGPDGGVYINDWTDTGECHNYLAVDQTNGRIYKVVYGTPKRSAELANLDLSKASDADLVRYQLHKNEWFARHARRVLQERAAAGNLSPETGGALKNILETDADTFHKLRALWTLHAINGLDRSGLLRLLDNPEPYVRAWTIQLALEDRAPSKEFVEKLTALAQSDPSPVVRLYLASALQRLAVSDRWAVAEGLARHGEDAKDQNIPLMLWYGVEPMTGSDVPRALPLLEQARIPIDRQFIARRATSEVGAMDKLIALVGSTKSVDIQRDVLRGINDALKEHRALAAPPEWAGIGRTLMDSTDAEVREKATLLAVLFGDTNALGHLRDTVAKGTDLGARQRALQALVQNRDPQLPAMLQTLLTDREMAGPALRAMAASPDQQTPRVIVGHYSTLGRSEKSDAINTLASRPEWSIALLDALDQNVIPRADVSTVILRQLLTFQNRQVNQKLAKVWGNVRTTPEDKRNLIAKFRAIYTPERLRGANLSNGRAVFNKTCAQCHTLYDSGGHVGPDLTGSQRADLGYLFENVLDPSAVVAKEYLMTIVRTKDGRVINGIIQKENAAAVTLRTTTEDVVVPTDEIEKRVTSNQSMMPEGLLEGLDANDARDLIGYLSGEGQVELPPGRK